MISQWRHRRRHRDAATAATDQQERRSNDEQQNPSASLHEGRKKKRQSCCCCCNRNRQRSRIGVLIIIIIIAERKFVMGYNSTFVVNLDSDRERWVAFQSVNQKRIEDIERISATTLIQERGELFLPLTQKQSKESEEKEEAIIEDHDATVELKKTANVF